MNKEHVISEEVLNAVVSALANNLTWFVYNTLSYFPGKTDVQLFNTEKEATDWAFENNSKTEAYRTIQITTLSELYRQIKYGEQLDTLLSQP